MHLLHVLHLLCVRLQLLRARHRCQRARAQEPPVAAVPRPHGSCAALAALEMQGMSSRTAVDVHTLSTRDVESVRETGP